MRYEWLLTYSDYLAAQKLFNRGSLWRRLYTLIFLWVLPSLALLSALLIAAINLANHNIEALQRGFVTIGPFLFFALLCRFSYSFNLKRNYKRLFLNGDPTKPVYMDIDDERLISGVPGSSEGKFFWPTIERFAESESIVLLYISKRLFLMIPKNQLDVAEWNEMRAFLLAHIRQAV